MRDSQKIEKSGLFDLVHCIFVGVVVGEDPLSDGVKDVGVEGCRIIYNVRLANEF